MLRQHQALLPKPSDLSTLLAHGAGAAAVHKLKGNTKLASGGGKNSKSRAPLDKKEEFAMTVLLLIDVDAALQPELENSSLHEELVRVRRALYLDLGVPFPGIHLRFNQGMKAGEYLIQLQEVPVACGQLRPGKLLVLEKAAQLELMAIPFVQGDAILPGSPTLWTDNTLHAKLDKATIQTLDSGQVLTWHLSHVLKQYAGDFIGIQETRYLLEHMEQGYAELVKEAQRIMPIQRMTEILQRLVGEDISIRNMRAILEAMVEWGQKEKEVVQLVEYIRSSLKRYICYKYANGNNVLPAYLLDQEVEEKIRNGIRQTSAGSYLALEPSASAAFLQQVRSTVGDLTGMQSKPVLIVSMDIRRYVRKLIEGDYYDLPVLSYQELTQQINIQPLGRVCL